jgi:D-lactate dehydrogenase
METTDTVALLGDVEIFRLVEDETLEAVASALEERTLESGDLLFREGDPGGYVFLVARGRLEVLKETEDGLPVLLRVMDRGQVGGMTSTVVGRSRSATLRARGQVTVLTLPRDRFLDLLEQRPDLARSALAFLGDKVRRKTARLATLSARDQSGEGEPMAVFDTKPYDRHHLTEASGDELAPTFFEARLRPETAGLARGFRVVCAFVNDELGPDTLERLAEGGTELVALRCAGFNNVDTPVARRHRITVVRVPYYSPHAVAEHTVALILNLNRKIHRAYQRVREGNFSLNGLVGFDLHGRTAGVVGVGQIGRRVAELLKGFGMRVLAYDPAPDPDYARRAGIEYVELDTVFGESDVLTLNAPLTPQTHHMIDAAAIRRMKPGVMVINTGRGALVDTAALIDGLKTGEVGAAGLDVYEEESEYFFEDRSDAVITDDLLARLLTFPNVLITSHQAFLTRDALDAIAATTVENIRQYLAGRRGEEINEVRPPGSS